MTKTITLGDETFNCIETMPMGYVFDLAEAMASGDIMAAVAGMSRTIRTLVVKEEQTRLAEVLHRIENPVGFDELNEALGTAVTQYTQRPLGQPATSPSGRSSTGGVSKVVSFSRGTVKTEETSPKDGAQRAS
jgi:hypothetical protein